MPVSLITALVRAQVDTSPDLSNLDYSQVSRRRGSGKGGGGRGKGEGERGREEWLSGSGFLSRVSMDAGDTGHPSHCLVNPMETSIMLYSQ